jgi:DNA-binding MarR family transcriptional regulator
MGAFDRSSQTIDIVIVTETIMHAPMNDGLSPGVDLAPPSPPADAERRMLLIARIGEAVRAVASHQRCATASRLHRAGISMGHLHVIWILGEHGPLPIGRLAELVGVAVPNATGLVDRMEQRGLVTRERVADDRRVVLVRVTDAGREVADDVDGWRAGTLQRLFGHFENPELERMLAAIDAERAAFASDPESSSLTPCLDQPNRPDGPKETTTR